MWRMGLPSGRSADALALEANADRARRALACAYSSSDEFEADVIKAQRQAGAYGPRRQQRQAVIALATASAVIVAICLVAF
jgi:hypothetical protein